MDVDNKYSFNTPRMSVFDRLSAPSRKMQFHSQTADSNHSVHSSAVSSSSNKSLSDDAKCHLCAEMRADITDPLGGRGSRMLATFVEALCGNSIGPPGLSKHRQHQVSQRINNITPATIQKRMAGHELGSTEDMSMALISSDRALVRVDGELAV